MTKPRLSARTVFVTWLTAALSLALGARSAGADNSASVQTSRFTSGSAWVARHDLRATEYQSELDRWVGLGYRLTYISGYEQNGEARYAALWERSVGPSWVARHGLTAAQYQEEFDAQVANGYRPVLVNGYTVGGTDYYAAIWEQSSGVAWIARHGLSSSEYQQAFDANVANGYRLTHISGYGAANQTFAAIWVQDAGPAFVARHGLTPQQYQEAFDAQGAAGYHPVLVAGYPAAGEVRYVAIWEQGPVEPWVARHGLSAAVYQQTFDDLRYQGYRPAVVSGYDVGGTSGFAAIFRNDAMSGADLDAIDASVQSVMSASSVPAVSLAITKATVSALELGGPL